MSQCKLDVITLGETMALFTPNKDGYLRYANNYTRSFVGSETNVAIGVTRLGHKVGWISKVGNDEFGKALLMHLKGEGIDISHVKEVEANPTGLMFKEFLRENQMRVTYYRKNSAASTLQPSDIDESYLASASYMFISGITPALSHKCKETVFHAMQLAKKNNVQIVFDPNLRRTLWGEAEARDTLLEMAKYADIILPGISEGEFLFETKDEQEIGSRFLELGAKKVVIKLGDKGAVYFSNSHSKANYVEGYKVNRVIDPIGAGDAFAAGFLTGVIEKLSIHEAVERANAFGALATQVKGDIEGVPERDQLIQFMNASSEDVER